MSKTVARQGTRSDRDTSSTNGDDTAMKQSSVQSRRRKDRTVGAQAKCPEPHRWQARRHKPCIERYLYEPVQWKHYPYRIHGEPTITRPPTLARTPPANPDAPLSCQLRMNKPSSPPARRSYRHRRHRAPLALRRPRSNTFVRINAMTSNNNAAAVPRPNSRYVMASRNA